MPFNMKYAIRFEHESLTFRASHSIFYGSSAEPMHEHLFRIRVSVFGPLNRNLYVVDFVKSLELLQIIVVNLNNKVFLPEDAINLPENEIVRLPYKNTTAESIAAWIAGQFRYMLIENALLESPPEEYSIEIELQESNGCWAIVRDSI